MCGMPFADTFSPFFIDMASVPVDNPQLAIAIATSKLVNIIGALVIVMAALVVAVCVIGCCQIRVISWDINRVVEASDKHDKRHQDFMEAEARRHKKAMDALAAERAAGKRRHEQAMKALDALTRNTAPGPAAA